MQNDLAPIFCFLPSVVPRLRPEKLLLDLFFPVEFLGGGQRGLDVPKLIPRFSWYISTHDVGGPFTAIWQGLPGALGGE